MKANLVTRGSVPLLANYEAAKAAVAACARVDECLSLSDKAVALRAYARQAKDKTMERNAQRIQIRALRQCGNLLKGKGAKAHRGKKGVRAPIHLSDRARSAKEAGLSNHEKHTALRLADVAAKPTARKKPKRNPAGSPVSPRERVHIIDTFFVVGQRMAGIEARVKAEARIANERLSKIEARLDRIASALHRLIAARDDTSPSDSENE